MQRQARHHREKRNPQAIAEQPPSDIGNTCAKSLSVNNIKHFFSPQELEVKSHSLGLGGRSVGLDSPLVGLQPTLEYRVTFIFAAAVTYLPWRFSMMCSNSPWSSLGIQNTNVIRIHDRLIPYQAWFGSAAGLSRVN